MRSRESCSVARLLATACFQRYQSERVLRDEAVSGSRTGHFGFVHQYWPAAVICNFLSVERPVTYVFDALKLTKISMWQMGHHMNRRMQVARGRTSSKMKAFPRIPLFMLKSWPDTFIKFTLLLASIEPNRGGGREQLAT